MELQGPKRRIDFVLEQQVPSVALHQQIGTIRLVSNGVVQSAEEVGGWQSCALAQVVNKCLTHARERH